MDRSGNAALVDELSLASGLPIAIVDSGGNVLYRSIGLPPIPVDNASQLQLPSTPIDGTELLCAGNETVRSARLVVSAENPVRFAVIGPTALRTDSPFGDIWPQLLLGILISSALLALLFLGGRWSDCPTT